MEKSLKVLVAIDASKYVAEILDEICRRKWSDGTQIRVLTVVSTDSISEASEQYTHECQVILNDHVGRLTSRLTNCKIQGECLEGSPATTIVEVAAHWDADLIVLGSHGDTGIRSDRVGSVAASIVNTAPCSVEVIKVYGRKRETTHG